MTMPALTKKFKEENAFFINEKGKVQYNEKCQRCIHDCKQSYRAVVVYCPKHKCAY